MRNFRIFAKNKQTDFAKIADFLQKFAEFFNFFQFIQFNPESFSGGADRRGTRRRRRRGRRRHGARHGRRRDSGPWMFFHTSLEGSFSAGSTATIATKYSFFQVFERFSRSTKLSG